MAVVGGLTAPSGFVPLEIPRILLKGGRISRQELESIERRPDSYFNFLDLATTIEDAVYISGARLAHMFFHLPTIVRIDSLFDAAHFYQEAVRDFQFAGDDVREILAEPEARPEAAADRIALESATLNSFRAVEAIVGEPGKGERFRERLLGVGINPDEKVGYEGDPELKISERILLQDLRNKTSGHGRRRRADPLKFREAMEAQHLAKAVVAKALIHYTSSIGRADGKLTERRFLLGQMFGNKAIRRIRRKFPKLPPEVLVERPGGFQQLIGELAELDRTDVPKTCRDPAP